MNRLSDSAPRWLWMLMVGGTAGVVLTGAFLAALLASGMADPPHAGRRILQTKTIDWAGGAQLNLSPGERAYFMSPVSLSKKEFTIELTAGFTESSDVQAAWGVWLRDSIPWLTVIAINGAGYVTAQRCASLQVSLDDCTALQEPTQGIPMYWKDFPHLFSLPEQNQLYLHYKGEKAAALRLNREWMWDVPLGISGEWGIWARGGRSTTSTLRWEKLAIYGD